MKIMVFVVVLIKAAVLAGIGYIVTDYVSCQNAKFYAAVEAVERQMYQNMLKAQREQNPYKARFYRYQMENAGKLVLELGADYFLENEETR